MENLERVKGHMAKFESKAPIEEILDDYAENAVVEMQGSRFEGHEQISNFFSKALGAFGDQSFQDVEYKELEDGSIEVSWKVGPIGGGDKFWFDDSGLFIRQKAYMGPRPEDF
jgi:hypothetical protein